MTTLDLQPLPPGWSEGSAAEFLGMSQEEETFAEIFLDLAELVRCARERAGLTHAQAARRLKSTAARVRMMESADPRLTLDALVEAAIKLGASRDEIGRAVEGPRSSAGPVTPSRAAPARRPQGKAAA
jgi:hypothetical protein